HGVAGLSPVSPVPEHDPTRADSRLSTSSTLNDPQPQPNSIRSTTLPAASTFSNPYTPSIQATPLTSTFTPRTGNPLLGGFPNTTHLDDTDTSDLDPTSRYYNAYRAQVSHLGGGSSGHMRSSSADRRREMGLTINTQGGQKTRKKPAPLPLRAVQVRTKTEADVVGKKNPIASLLGKGSGSGHVSAKGGLRRMFPSS
ncbi:hypothetical protein LTR66_016495, partial [Elasticomyces elasticus]